MLSTYEFAMGVAVFRSYTASSGLESPRSKFLVIYGIILACSFLATVFTKGYSSSKVSLLNDITWRCVLDRGYPTPKLYLTSDNKPHPMPWLKLLPVAVLLTVAIMFIIKYTMTRPGKGSTILRSNFVSLYARLHLDSEKFQNHLWAIIITLLWMADTITVLVFLLLQRRQLRLISVYENQKPPSQWGFGQVPVLMIWLAVVVDICFRISSQCDFVLKFYLDVYLITN